MAYIWQIIKTARITHWIKNLALFAPLVFSGNLFVPELFFKTFWATIIFSLAASACYLFNDVADREKDIKHPVKRRRSVASGTLPVHLALFSSAVLAVSSLFAASFLSFFLFMAIFTYILLQLFYTLILKTIPIIDILSIAGGFILRIWAGAFVGNIHPSVWFLLCVVSVALFLATGKRKAEVAIIQAFNVKKRFLYSPTLLDSYLAMFATSSWISWALFTFFEPSPQVGSYLPFFTDLPLTLAGIGKWLMITIPVVIFGIMRYLHIVYNRTWAAETPERTLIKDTPLLLSVILWTGLVLLILYS